MESKSVYVLLITIFTVGLTYIYCLIKQLIRLLLSLALLLLITRIQSEVEMLDANHYFRCPQAVISVEQRNQ